MVCFDLVQTPSGSLMPAPRSSARTFFKRSMIGITWKTAGTKIHTTSTAANVIAPICRFQVCVNKSLQSRSDNGLIVGRFSQHTVTVPARPDPGPDREPIRAS
jgi:hypothetical protein